MLFLYYVRIWSFIFKEPVVLDNCNVIYSLPLYTTSSMLWAALDFCLTCPSSFKFGWPLKFLENTKWQCTAHKLGGVAAGWRCGMLCSTAAAKKRICPSYSLLCFTIKIVQLPQWGTGPKWFSSVELQGFLVRK